MHIVHVVHCLQIGGLENGIVNLVNAPRPGQRHTVVCMTHGGANRERLRPDVEVFELGKSAGHDLPTFGRLVRLLRRLRPDVVHTRNWATFDGVVAARLAGVSRIAHGEHGRDISDPEGRHRRRNTFRRLLAPLVRRFVTVSDDLQRWLVHDVGIAASKVTRIHNGVDTDRYAPRDRRASRAALQLPLDRTVIGTVGRLDPVKDHASLLRAFAALSGRDPDSILVIAGDGPCRDELQALAVSLGLTPRVRFLGVRHDVAAVLPSFDVFVLPSIAEGISNTILEAMAAGLPVIATRVGGNPELVVDGETGRLVPREDPERLAAAIAGYVVDAALRSRHGDQARRRTLEQFSLAAMRDAYARLYVELHEPRTRVRLPARPTGPVFQRGDS
jgi:sugar transferase (PEP-CTERM/EpsH1 system associated)